MEKYIIFVRKTAREHLTQINPPSPRQTRLRPSARRSQPTTRRSRRGKGGGEEMEKEYLYGIIGILAGIILAGVFANNAVNSNNQRMMGMMGIRAQAPSCQMENIGQSQMSMEDHMMGMTSSLEGKTGDEFDKTFIEEMIVHHQGAIEMAELAKENANRKEIKSLADDIISAQTKEIEMMRGWQKSWRY